jgi:hypothetical protein
MAKQGTVQGTSQGTAVQVRPAIPRARKAGFAVTKPGRVRVPAGFWKQGGLGYEAVANTSLTLEQAAEKLAAWGVHPAAIAWYRAKYGLPVDQAAKSAAMRAYNALKR